MKDQRDCVLNDLQQLGDKEFLVLMDQYNIEIFSCCLRLLPCYFSTFHQTNVENSQIRTEDNLLISRIRSLHHLLEVDDHDEEEHSVVLTLGNRLENNLLAQHQSTFFHRWVKFLWWAGKSTSLWFCFGLWSARKSKYIRFQRTIVELHLGGSLLVVVVLLVVAQFRDQLIQAMRNSSDPTSENCLCLQIQFWLPLHINLAGSWLWLLTRAQFWCSLESNLSGQMIFHLLAKVYSRRVTGSVNCKNSSVSLSWSTVRHQPLSGILHRYKT